MRGNRNVLTSSLLMGVTLAAILAGGLGSDTPRIRSKPSIVYVLIDTLRPDHLSCYGYEAVTTPTIDSLLETGMCFDHAFTPVAVTFRPMPQS